MLKIALNNACTDTSLPILQRDQLLYGANNGVLSLFDIANTFCYDQTTAVSNGKTITNINESGNNGSLVIASGKTITIGGNGVIYNELTDKNSYVNGNAAACANIWASGTGTQYFLFCMYVKLPTLANWNTDAIAFSMLQFAADTGDYRTIADLLTLTQTNGGGLAFRRQKAVNSIDVLGITPVNADYGSFVQLAFWRNASGQGARLKSENGTILTTTTTNAANSANFSTASQKIGSVGTFNVPSASNANAVKWKYYRSFIENLVTSGRDPVTVLNEDYARTIARGVFS